MPDPVDTDAFRSKHLAHMWTTWNRLDRIERATALTPGKAEVI